MLSTQGAFASLLLLLFGKASALVEGIDWIIRLIGTNVSLKHGTVQRQS